MNFTEEQILTLAPDDASRKAGKGLSKPGDWVSFGADDAALWGECQGSGAKPYQTQVDVTNIAFKCSCPSRKFPCKHGLGLMLLYARNPAAFTVKQQPDWVAEWIGKRAVKAEKAAEPEAPRQADEAAQAKRQQARANKVSDGIDELLLWLKDIVRNGLLIIPGKEAALQNMAKRMVDAQAGGLAGIIRGFNDINFYKDGWHSLLFDKLVTLYLLAAGYKNLDALDPALQQEVRSFIGFTQNLEEIKARDGIKDDWFVLGRQFREDEQLTIERNWLYGLRSGQYALVLNFWVNNQVKDLPMVPGTVIEGELVFFNPGMSVRALIKQRAGQKAGRLPAGFPGWNAVTGLQTAMNERNPFVSELPFVINSVQLVRHRDQWWLQDTENNMMQLQLSDDVLWRFLAVSGGQQCTVSVVGYENNYVPLGAWINNEYKTLA